MTIVEATILICLLIGLVLVMGLNIYYYIKEIAIHVRIERTHSLQVWYLKAVIKVQVCEIKILKEKSK